MEFKNLTDTIAVPVIGLGTWTIGGGDLADTTHDNEDVSAIETAIKLGITHIDTAEAYAQGHTEELIGRAIRGYDRKSLFITSKVSPEHLGYDNLIASAKGSLQRLWPGSSPHAAAGCDGGVGLVGHVVAGMKTERAAGRLKDATVQGRRREPCLQSWPPSYSSSPCWGWRCSSCGACPSLPNGITRTD